jgi:predicted amidohydrolase
MENLIRDLSANAAAKGAQVIAFHECSITGYTFARHLSKQQMLEVAEFIPEGPSIQKLTEIAKESAIIVLAGLFEKDADDKLFKAYVCVGRDGLIAKYRKLHPFINPYLTPGNEYVIFDLHGWKCSILICYDNNIIENVRAVKLLGADIVFMPHVTMCTPSTRPGAGFVDPKLWENREADPTTLRQEFDSLKGRALLMKWLPARAYDNAIYAIFANAIGMDDDQLKNGCSMIIDPFGDIVAECRSLNNEIAVATITPEKLTDAGGHRYINARRPELYGDIIAAPHQSEQKVVWMK